MSPCQRQANKTVNFLLPRLTCLIYRKLDMAEGYSNLSRGRGQMTGERKVEGVGNRE